ncbi:MAG: transposase [Myxococcales bacterium]|nr:transposase [Myxococcales bacterium]
MRTSRSPRKQAPRQLTLESARKPTGHGGWRAGAGRPRGRKTVSHDARERFAARHPLHVTLRIRPDVHSLRRGKVCATIRAALAAGGHKPAFRVVEFNALHNHLHLLIEAEGPAALARGMQGLSIRLARCINRLLGRTGSLFATRYHARALRTPREVRNAIRYVLLNARHHAAERGRRLARDWIDPYSSAPWFDGFHSCPLAARGLESLRAAPDWLAFLQRQPRPTATARTWLLSTGWRRHGAPLHAAAGP